MLIESQCDIRDCKHFIGVTSEGIEVNERYVCKAFPKGIPLIITLGNNKHLKPFKGDHGIIFAKRA